MYDFSKIKFDTFWRESQNRIYLDDMYELLPNAPKDVIDSYNLVIIVIKIRLVRQNEIYQNLYLKDDAFKAVCLKDWIICIFLNLILK